MRLAAKTDTNHAAVRQAFRKMGFSVADTSRQGKGFPDLVISRDRITALIEVKRDKAAKLTQDQIDFHGEWKGLLFVVTGPDDCINVNQAMLSEARMRQEAIYRKTLTD